MPALREAIAADATRTQGLHRDRGPGRGRAGRQAHDVLRAPRPGAGGRRGRLPGPGLPDLRVDGPLRRRDAGPVPDHPGARLPGGPRRARGARDRPDAAADHQLAREPHRRRLHARRHRADRGARAAPPRGHRPRRRDLRPDRPRRRARLDRVAARPRGPDDRARRLLEDVRDDRLAAGLRDPAAGPRRPVREADHQLRVVRVVVQPGGGDRGADRAPGRRRRDGRRVPRAPDARRRRAQPDPRASSARSRPARSTSSRGSAARA